MSQKGNKNAYKHGIYSSFIATADEPSLKNMKPDNNRDEIAYARTRLAAAHRELKKCTDPDQQIKWDYACRHWTEIIVTAISHNTNRPITEFQIFTTLLDAVRAANDKQQVK